MGGWNWRSCLDHLCMPASGQQIPMSARFHPQHTKAGLRIMKREHRVILGLPDGTVLDRRNCIDTVNRAWCRVSLVVAPGVTGYVSSSYLAPR